MGGYETLVSFGIDAETADHGTLDDLCALIAERVPAEAIDFLDRGENLVLLGDYLFVHAGIRPGKPLDQQAGADLRWLREDRKSVAWGRRVAVRLDLGGGRSI